MNSYSNDTDGSFSGEAWDSSLQTAIERIADRKADPSCVHRVIEQALQMELNACDFSPATKLVTECDRSLGEPLEKVQSQPRRRFMVALSGFTAAAACLLAVGWFTLDSGNAFAQLQQKLAELRSMEFSFQSTSEDEGSVGKVYVVEPDRYREELPDGRVFVTDLKKKLVMELDTESKKGEIYPLTKTEPRDRAMEWFSRLRAISSSAERLGRRKVDGREVIDFKVHIDGEPEYLKVTVDKSSFLPVRVERVKSITEEVLGCAYDFAFDKPIEDRLVSVIAPEGFEVVTFLPEGDAQDLKLVVGPEGIGAVNWGMKKDEVVELLGKPDGVKSFDVPHQNVFSGKESGRTSGDELIYDSRGYRVIVSKRNGVETITCYGSGAISDRMQPFSGITDQGLLMDATEEDVIEVYGTPEQKTANQLIYFKLGLEFQFNGGLSLIIVRSPVFRPNANGIFSLEK